MTEDFKNKLIHYLKTEQAECQVRLNNYTSSTVDPWWVGRAEMIDDTLNYIANLSNEELIGGREEYLRIIERDLSDVTPIKESEKLPQLNTIAGIRFFESRQEEKSKLSDKIPDSLRGISTRLKNKK
jgi:hypothetical protein